MAFNQPFQIIGFHSCDKEVGLRILNGEDQLKHSTNSWDWLGSGIYFWEQNPEKALEYAIKCATGKQKYNGNIKTPFVIGAIIELGNCLNLVEPKSLNILHEVHKEPEKTFNVAGKKLPTTKGTNRKLDCAVIQSIHETNKRSSIMAYDTVRSPFHDDEELYPTSNFSSGLHIEISVINEAMSKGYFLPKPLKQFNPYL